MSAPAPSTPSKPAPALCTASSSSSITRYTPSHVVIQSGSSSTPFTPGLSPQSSSANDAASESAELQTPSTPTPVSSGSSASSDVNRRKSAGLLRRKPIPWAHPSDTPLPASSSSISEDPFTVATEAAPPSITASTRRYTLHADPPSYDADEPLPLAAIPSSSPDLPSTASLQPPAYGQASSSSSTSSNNSAGSPSPEYATAQYSLAVDLGISVPLSTRSQEQLPTYASESATEPQTLARGLWRWGFLCPFLWLIGICM